MRPIAFLSGTFSQGLLNITIIYGLGPPVCWGSIRAGWYSAMVLFVSVSGMIFGFKGFAIHLLDTWIIQVGKIFGIANGLFW